MMKRATLIDDYSPHDESATVMHFIRGNDGDFHFQIYDRENGGSKSLRVAMSGTRYSLGFRKALIALMEAVENEAKTNRFKPIAFDEFE